MSIRLVLKLVLFLVAGAFLSWALSARIYRLKSEHLEQRQTGLYDAVIAIGDHKAVSRFSFINQLYAAVGYNVNLDQAVKTTEQRLTSLGYNVLIDNEAHGSDVIRYLTNNNLRAFVFIGHSIGEQGVVGMKGSDDIFVAPDMFIPTQGHPVSRNLHILVIAGCGSANTTISGLSWKSVCFSPNARCWFWGYCDPEIPVSQVLSDLDEGRDLPGIGSFTQERS